MRSGEPLWIEVGSIEDEAGGGDEMVASMAVACAS